LDFRECVFVNPADEPLADPTEAAAALRRLNVRGHYYGMDRNLDACVTFVGAKFEKGAIDFSHSIFRGGVVDFFTARFEDADVEFSDLTFEDGKLDFSQALVTSHDFHMERGLFSGGVVSFDEVRFYGRDCYASFGATEWSGAVLELVDCKFAATCFLDFRDTRFLDGVINFTGSGFAGARVRFDGIDMRNCSLLMKDTAYYEQPEVTFSGNFVAGRIDFESASFFTHGVSFRDAKIIGTVIDFSRIADWSSPPDLPGNSAESGLVLLPEALPDTM
jgi:uncharacterized protein YjbI with pentapeptide repeats